MKFYKYHALGNDYIVIDPKELKAPLTKLQIQVVCDRHYGIGSDGILFGPLESDNSQFRLQIFNPDGSEAEKSGNGLRIFSRYLWDKKAIDETPFTIETKGGEVKATIKENGARVSVEMGKVRFTHHLDDDPVIEKFSLIAGEKQYSFYFANVGNPHCVIPVDFLSPEETKVFGPLIEISPLFPERTNVQFLKVIDQNNVQIEIWERGAGYTLASGSSSTAAAAVAHALGLCSQNISVKMPGGTIEIDFSSSMKATMTGDVCKIAEGRLSEEGILGYPRLM